MREPFLPGVPVQHVLDRLDAAGGNEIASGKFAHPESSAALAVNAFGWFIERPQLFPALPGPEFAGDAQRVEVEYCARFPWSRGRHPWLDAVVFTKEYIIGVESKRYEPFRDAKHVSLPPAYDRPVWGDKMLGFCAVRDALRSGELQFRHLDAAQLVKHAFGLVTEGRRLGKRPQLFYIFAEPAVLAGKAIPSEDHARHRVEIATFAAKIAGDEVRFASGSYHEWLSTWTEGTDEGQHAVALRRLFSL